MSGLDELRAMMDGYQEAHIGTGTFADKCERVLPALLAVVDAAEEMVDEVETNVYALAVGGMTEGECITSIVMAKSALRTAVDAVKGQA